MQLLAGRRGVFTIATAALFLASCSTVMEANRPSAVSLAQFNTGLRRIEVIEKLGAPASSVKTEGKSCDIYKLYTHGTSKVAKGAIIVGEAAADVFTAGLFEVVGTSAEAASKAHIHTVLFCYSDDERLTSVIDEGHTLTADHQSLQPQPPKPTPASTPAPEPAPTLPPSTAANAAPSPTQPAPKPCKPAGLSMPTDPSALNQVC